MAGRRLDIPLGDRNHSLTVSPKADSIRFSLGSTDPATVKVRHAEATAYLETIFAALRDDKPVMLTRKQAAALAGEVYRAWEGQEEAEVSIQVEMTANGPVVTRQVLSPEMQAGAALSTLENLMLWEASDRSEDADKLDRAITPLIDRVLSWHGITRVDDASFELLSVAFLQALKDALAIRQKRVKMDFTPDPNAVRYPEWEKPAVAAKPAMQQSMVSLKGLVDSWWKEAKAADYKISTYDSYRNTMAVFVRFLKHDDASRVTPEDVIAFKDHRLGSKNPNTGKPISPKTVKDSDLAGLKSVFGWAVSNRKMAINPAEGVTLKVKRRQKLRPSGYTDSEALELLTAASTFVPGREAPKLVAAKRWAPWLMAFSGARVGEIVQLRKEDIRKDGDHWVLHIDPEAFTQKTNEARDVVIHPQVIERGFADFVAASKPGYLFMSPRGTDDKAVRGAWRTTKNRLAEAARQVVGDDRVAPNHGWRHRFKTVGREVDIDGRVLGAIEGHTPANVGDTYGDVTLKTIAAAILKLPRYDVG